MSRMLLPMPIAIVVAMVAASVDDDDAHAHDCASSHDDCCVPGSVAAISPALVVAHDVAQRVETMAA